MAIDYSFVVLGDRKVEISYHKDKIKLQLKVKRSFTILVELLKAYPNFYNLHDLDKTLNDPNRAFSSLKLEDGYGEYLIEKNSTQNLKTTKIDIDKLFNNLTVNTDAFITLHGSDLRKILTPETRKEIYNKFHGICNITKIKLYEKLPLTFFFKRGLEATYDHRIPLAMGGKDKLDNVQLISVYANSEKNKLCNSCQSRDCKRCALAFPEEYDIIQANNQNVSQFKK